MSETKRLWADDIRARYGADMRAQYVLASDYDRDLAELRRQRDEAVAAEREACAKLCDAMEDRARAAPGGWPEKEAFLDGKGVAAEELARQIRERVEGAER